MKQAERDGWLDPALVSLPVWKGTGLSYLLYLRPMLVNAWRSADPAEWVRVLALAEQAIAKT